jgi:hypothetical protein
MKLNEVFQEFNNTNTVYILFKRAEGYGGDIVESPVAAASNTTKLIQYMKELPQNTDREDSNKTQYYIKKTPIPLIN